MIKIKNTKKREKNLESVLLWDRFGRSNFGFGSDNSDFGFFDRNIQNPNRIRMVFGSVLDLTF